MSKHLVSDTNPILVKQAVWTEVNHWQYFKKRVQFWKWTLHRTMGRPILKPRTPTKEEEKL